MDDDGSFLGIDTSGRQPVVRQAAPSTGHNSRQLELDKIVAEAVRGLKVVEDGEAKSAEGWIIYGEALNKGRKMFSRGGQGDKDFGAWVVAHQLDGPSDMERLAAMWAAENTDLMYEIMEDNPRIKTVRGAHAKHKAILADEEKGDETEDDTSEDTDENVTDDTVVDLEDGEDTDDSVDGDTASEDDTTSDESGGIGSGTSGTPNTDPLIHNVSMIASCFIGVRTNLMMHKAVNKVDSVSDYDLARAMVFEVQKHYEDEEAGEVLQELKDLALQLSRAADITLTETNHNVVAFNSK
tara:strand:- start:510 stop:1397 length:888 start_codon:yes stop_codon:yes gene_type:complete